MWAKCGKICGRCCGKHASRFPWFVHQFYPHVTSYRPHIHYLGLNRDREEGINSRFEHKD